ncbi:MAG: DNA translocase FtsK [Chloroflexi bacterium]|nr:DNA translocase FtsK [Chloroflexota bacterium]
MSRRRKGRRRGGGWKLPVLLLVALVAWGGVVLAGPAALRDPFWKALGPPVAVAPLALAGVLWVAWRRPGLFVRRWNRWLGGLSLALAGMLLFSFFHPTQGAFASSGLAGDLGKGLRDFFGPGAWGTWSLSNLKIELPAWGGLGGLLLLGLGGAFVFSPRATARAFRRGVLVTAEGGLRLGRGAGRLARLVRRRPPAVAPAGPAATAPPSPAAQATMLAPAPAPTLSPESPARPARLPLPTIAAPWTLPPLELLDPPRAISFDQEEAQGMARRLEEALASYGIEARTVAVNPGPTVTQFGVEPGWVRRARPGKPRESAGPPEQRQEEAAGTRVKVEAIAALDRDLALALAVSSVRIEAPVPGKGYVGVEVPNTNAATVGLRNVVEAPAFAEVHAQTKLALPLGLGVGGHPGVADLTRLPHLLMAGATGSGKSVCLKSFLTSLVLTTTPQEVRLVLIDPKRVEFTRFWDLPHLLYPPIVEADQAALVLQDLIQEMNERYRLMAGQRANILHAYNQQAAVPLPYIVVIVDELADLMMTTPKETEHGLTRLAQLGRAAGIHLIVATQRPSVDVVTGLIKANFPSRISFDVASQVDSRVILDMPGAEHLLGRGDMLFLPSDASQPWRYQGCLVSDAEMERIVGFWARQVAPAPTGSPGVASSPGPGPGPRQPPL